MGDWLLGIGLVLLPLAVAGLIIFLVLRKIRRDGLAALTRRDASRESQVQAIWAAATVVSVRQSRGMADGHVRANVELRLKVEPPSGEAYLALANWLVDQAVLAQLQPGSHLSVKIDARDPQVIYPNISGAEAAIV